MTKEEFVGWQSYRATEEIRNYIKHCREEAAFHLLSLCSSTESPNDMVKAAKYAGLIMGLDTFLDLTFEEL